MNNTKFRVRDPWTKSYIFNWITIDEALRTKTAFLPQDVVYELCIWEKDRKWNYIFEWDIVQNIVWLRWVVVFWYHTLPVAEYDWERTLWYFVYIWWLEKSLWDWNFPKRTVVWNINQNPEIIQ